jgi:hypothetical protein
LITIPVVDGYLPVNKDALWAAQTGIVEIALQKLTPSQQNLSMLGVIAFLSPAYPTD